MSAPRDSWKVLPHGPLTEAGGGLGVRGASALDAKPGLQRHPAMRGIAAARGELRRLFESLR